MRKVFTAVLAVVCVLAFTACRNYETYGDKKKKERSAISDFIGKRGIRVIDESVFHQQGDVTDTSRNEYVYMNNSGVYMQIRDAGCGRAIADGEQADLLVRFFEMCLMDSTFLANDTSPYDVDVLNIKRTGSSYTGSFTDGLMKATYGYGGAAFGAAQGMLVAFPYIKLGRPRTADEHVASVRLIVPHSQGHTVASNYVYPYYYEFTFQRQTDL